MRPTGDRRQLEDEPPSVAEAPALVRALQVRRGAPSRRRRRGLSARDLARPRSRGSAGFGDRHRRTDDALGGVVPSPARSARRCSRASAVSPPDVRHPRTLGAAPVRRRDRREGRSKGRQCRRPRAPSDRRGGGAGRGTPLRPDRGRRRRTGARRRGRPRSDRGHRPRHRLRAGLGDRYRRRGLARRRAGGGGPDPLDPRRDRRRRRRRGPDPVRRQRHRPTTPASSSLSRTSTARLSAARLSRPTPSRRSSAPPRRR